MKHNETDIEQENISRLIRASYSSEARPSQEAKEQTYRILKRHVQNRLLWVDFPDMVVGALGFTLVAAVIFFIYQITLAGSSIMTDPALMVMATWLLLNLILIPIAGAVIVIRRQYG